MVRWGGARRPDDIAKPLRMVVEIHKGLRAELDKKKKSQKYCHNAGGCNRNLFRASPDGPFAVCDHGESRKSAETPNDFDALLNLENP